MDLSQNTELGVLYCRGNLLTTLDLSQNLDLRHLYCSKNHLKSLDVSNNETLYKLDCGDHLALTQLDISNNIKLRYLNCESTSLSTLDNSQNINLQELDCDEEVILNSELKYFPSAEGEYITTAESGLTVRKKPTIKSQRLGKIEFEAIILAKKTIVSYNLESEDMLDYWYEVQYQGETAYVYGGFLEEY